MPGSRHPHHSSSSSHAQHAYSSRGGGYGGLFITAMSGAAAGALATWGTLRMRLNSKFDALMGPDTPAGTAMTFAPTFRPGSQATEDQVRENTAAINDLKAYIVELHEVIDSLFMNRSRLNADEGDAIQGAADPRQANAGEDVGQGDANGRAAAAAAAAGAGFGRPGNMSTPGSKPNAWGGGGGGGGNPFGPRVERRSRNTGGGDIQSAEDGADGGGGGNAGGRPM
jgi:hypothetical protein